MTSCFICLALHPLCGSTSSESREKLLRSHEKGWNQQRQQVGDAVHRGRIAQLHNIAM
jgi:hypothetical protein